MAKDKTPAHYLLEELRIIPKLIAELRADIEATRSSVLSSPKWSDVKVQGGLRLSQEDKNIAIVDVTDYNTKQIENLLKRRQEIIDLLMTLPDMLQRHVLVTTYVNCQTFDEAIDRLEMNRNNYYMLKRKGVDSLDELLNRTKSVLNNTGTVQIDTQKY
ncbi:hypothetical protein Javan173_0026 [Streptococcus phage Javan173]|uniref:DUF1492 domain-containing protein n=1 Tax=Streptococcus entericus TaxID=155680 RepID=UPI00036F5714|nr:DUF1492 domain-containing protein [Streptococcus entericus]QBX15155.1 hypothetical protein Javan173_0026 [Streptococcus phage Javan173]